MYKKGREDEVEQTARFVASLSRQIPFQVMRFMPFGNSDGEKMEFCLAQTAGGDLTNQMVRKEARPGITIDPREFGHMAPQIIVVADTLAWPPADVIAWCKNNNLSAPAIREEKIFGLHPFRSSTNPDWILGLMALANIIHPSIFKFDLKKEADTFYNTFYGHPFNNGRLPAFPWEEKQ